MVWGREALVRRGNYQTSEGFGDGGSTGYKESRAQEDDFMMGKIDNKGDADAHLTRKRGGEEV